MYAQGIVVNSRDRTSCCHLNLICKLKANSRQTQGHSMAAMALHAPVIDKFRATHTGLIYIKYIGSIEANLENNKIKKQKLLRTTKTTKNK